MFEVTRYKDGEHHPIGRFTTIELAKEAIEQECDGIHITWRDRLHEGPDHYELRSSGMMLDTYYIWKD